MGSLRARRRSFCHRRKESKPRVKTRHEGISGLALQGGRVVFFEKTFVRILIWYRMLGRYRNRKAVTLSILAVFFFDCFAITEGSSQRSDSQHFNFFKITKERRQK